MTLSEDVAAISELIKTLDEEESITPLTTHGSIIEFTVQTPSGPARCELRCSDPADYPACSCSVKVVGGPSPTLTRLNGQLSKGGVRVATALARLGHLLDVELEWIQEVNPEGDDAEEMTSYNGDEGEDEEGEAENDVLREWSRRMVRVERIERELEEAAAEAAAAPGVVANLDALNTKQIFDSKAAFKRLTNELEEIFKAQSFSLVAEANGPDGLYTWDVTLGGFDPASPLAADLAQAGRKFGISSVLLRMVFKRGLHPFYPPSVRLVAPRFQAAMLGAVASHPLFTPSAWDPTVSAKEALLVVKSFLEAAGRLDLASPRNALAAAGAAAGGETPASAYSETEHLLAQLEALTGAPPIYRTDHEEVYRLRETALTRKDGAREPDAKKKRPDKGEEGGAAAAADGKLAWRAGVGYGHRDTPSEAVWDAKRAAAVQAARDAEVFRLLSSLAAELAADLGPGAGAGAREDCTRAVAASCLVPLLIRELAPASFQDMAARHGYYRALLDCAQALCAGPTAGLLTWQAGAGTIAGKSVASVMAKLSVQGSQFLRVYAQAMQGPAAGGASSSRAAARASSSRESEEDQRELRLAERITQVAAAVCAAVDGAGGAGPSTVPAAAQPEGPDAEYAATLGPFRTALVAGIAANHSSLRAAQGESTTPKLRARRVGRELASCESDLPVHASSSIFVVADESRSMLWKALITGPCDTPYEGGAFLFDIYFPEHYPSVPPIVLIRTTGGGAVRFNPNLYQCGKVCLSLLGTWSGKNGENWNADYSNIQQVLTSIQSLILVDQPYYNEPGYEARRDSAQSDAYSANIMEQTVRWAMLDQLRNPPAYFASVISAHFRLRGTTILGTVKRWVKWCKDKGYSRQSEAIRKMVPELEAALLKLTKT